MARSGQLGAEPPRKRGRCASDTNSYHVEVPWTLDWRSQEAQDISDWECALGEQRFRLHKLVLGWGSCGSNFFRAAFNKEFAKTSTDLAEVLPQPCHRYVETMIDFMYGKPIAPDPEGVVLLYKIADVLQMDALKRQMTDALNVVDMSLSQQLLQLGLEVQLPREAIDTLLQRVNITSVLCSLQTLAVGYPLDSIASALHTRVQQLQDTVMCLRGVCEGMAKSCVGHDIVMKFTGETVFKVPIARVSCRVFITKLDGVSPTIGVSKTDADVSRGLSASGGFAKNVGGWGLSLVHGRLWSNGTDTGTSVSVRNIEGKVMRMELLNGMLRFWCEADGDPLAELPVGDHGDLRFTLSCGNNRTELRILDLLSC